MFQVIILSLLIGLSGCASTLHVMFAKDVAQAKKSAKLLSKDSEFVGAYIRAALGRDMEDLSSEAQGCLTAIIYLAQQGQIRGLTEAELGTLTGKWDRFIVLCTPRVAAVVLPIISPFLGGL